MKKLPIVILIFVLSTSFESTNVAARTNRQCLKNYLENLRSTALLQTLNVELLTNKSATLVLEKWCADFRLAVNPVIVVDFKSNEVKRPDEEQIKRLQVASASEIAYRRVELRCGNAVLSKADNWYVPARLTKEMNATLASSHTPFGKVIASLNPSRVNLAVEQIWFPLPIGWAKQSIEHHCQHKISKPESGAIFQHRALVLNENRMPISEVREVYQYVLLAP